MKRLHLHISVPAMEPAIAFYNTMLNTAPVMVKDDYVKWMPDDPLRAPRHLRARVRVA